MAFINEDDLERAAIHQFEAQLGYPHVNCLHVEHLARTSRREVFDRERLLAALRRINPDLSVSVCEKAVLRLCDGWQGMPVFLANYEFYQLLTKGIEIKTTNAQGRDAIQTVRILDFQRAENNDFLLVSQLWIESETIRAERRPDLLVFINGLPLVFVELKRPDKPLEEAYDDNLMRYRDRIPQLFVPNVACVLSNGAEAKVGAYNAKYKFFKDWLRTIEDKDAVQPLNKKQAKASEKSLEFLIGSFFRKETLLDYIENFVLYEKERETKIVAQNHQFLGVNNALKSYEEKKGDAQANGLGTFWHTQGSGKSFSILFFTEKLRRKFVGDFTFLIITDRDDLDRQIHKQYVRTGIIADGKNAEKVRPANSRELREWLQGNKRYVFTLIHKFRPEQRGQRYPLLSDRRDIIVIVDEAHRTQYADLADNMRLGLPNARYLAFTGTPLIQSGITSKYFGPVISEYNFAQSIEDEATVPLFYNRRVPQVQIANDQLQEDYEAIVSGEDLTAEQVEKLEDKFIREYEVLKRDDRLETIAKDIVAHFPNRGYLGKGMVIAIDKFTAVRLYDKVKYHWDETKKQLQRDMYKGKSEIERQQAQQKFKWMQETQMAVVISSEDGEDEKFANKNLNIALHRKRMNEDDDKGHDIEDNFKDENHPLRLVFVCAMWLTGFDAPTVSTLYLDKPMQNHTLMQTIARANRVTAHTVNGTSKINGEIVDYYGVFRNLKKALAVYAQGSHTNGVQVEKIVEPADVLRNLLRAAIDQASEFCEKEPGFDIKIALNEKNAQHNTMLLEDFADLILAKDDWKKTFGIHQNLIADLFAACQPDILRIGTFKQEADLFKMLRGVVDRKGTITDDLYAVAEKVSGLLDVSVLAEPDPKYGFDKTWRVDLSRLDYEKLRQEFDTTKHKNIAIADIREFLEAKLQILIRQNPSRAKFRERYEALLQNYREGQMSAEILVDEFTAFMQSLEEEEQRHIKEGLAPEELVIFDLLEKPRLTPNEKAKVKETAQYLIARLREEQQKLFVADWHKNHLTRLQVEMVVNQILHDYLPETYTRTEFAECKQIVFSSLLEHRIQNIIL
jgi:type I restriction enzyme, R subunit